MSQVPFVRVASERSTTRVVLSRPEPVSLPQSMVRSTEVVVYQGLVVRSIDWPAGRVVSGVTVKVVVLVSPEPFVAVTVFAPVALSLPVQE